MEINRNGGTTFMMIVSSQHFLNLDIVAKKAEDLSSSGASEVVIPCWDIGECDGIHMAIQADGHHALAAARELGLSVRFDVSDDPEKLTGLAALDIRYNDGDWYNVETSDPVSGYFDLVW